MLAKCKFIECSKLRSRVKQRYSLQIYELEAEGFKYEGIMETDHSIAYLPFVAGVGLSGREVMDIRLPRVSWYHPLFRSEDGETIAYPLGIATRFYTFFEDGSIQRTSSGASSSNYVKRCKLFTEGVGRSIGDTWLHHLAFCEQRADEGKKPLASADVERLLEVQINEDTLTEKLMCVGMGWGPIGMLGFSAFQKALS